MNMMSAPTAMASDLAISDDYFPQPSYAMPCLCSQAKIKCNKNYHFLIRTSSSSINNNSSSSSRNTWDLAHNNHANKFYIHGQSWKKWTQARWVAET
jgi:hypothetical protein